VAGTATQPNGQEYQTRDAGDATRTLAAELEDPTKDPNLTIGDWPNVRMFQDLDTGRAFVRVGKASSTALVTVPRPSTYPSEETRSAILDRQRRAHEARERPPAAPATSQSEDRPHQKPQVARTAPDATSTPHQEPPPAANKPGDDFDEFLT
jgi:hypothetical protein